MISFKKYGPRSDHRKLATDELFSELEPAVREDAFICTDQNPHYRRWIRKKLPSAKHQAFKGRRGCVVGQGELKKIGRDPLFDLNHTAAMIRANINRLFRRTWCTTKLPERLADHLALYVCYHNTQLT